MFIDSCKISFNTRSSDEWHIFCTLKNVIVMHNYILYVQNKKPPLSLLLKADLEVLRISKNADYSLP